MLRHTRAILDAEVWAYLLAAPEDRAGERLLLGSLMHALRRLCLSEKSRLVYFRGAGLLPAKAREIDEEIVRRRLRAWRRERLERKP